MSLSGLLIFTVALKQSEVTDKNAMYLICSIRTEIIKIFQYTSLDKSPE